MSVSRTNPAIAEAWGVIKVLSADEEARLLAESREKARMDFEDRYDGAYRDGKTAGIEEGRQEGIEEGQRKGRQEGIEEGQRKGKMDVARNLLREKLPVDIVVKSTGLSREEVERIAAELSE